MAKERNTIIVAVRIKKELYAHVLDAVKTSKQLTRNAWLNWAIQQGLRRHKKEE